MRKLDERTAEHREEGWRVSRLRQDAIEYREGNVRVLFDAEYGAEKSYVYKDRPRVEGVPELSHDRLGIILKRILRAQEFLKEPTEIV